jgi:hypothetical protein
MSIRMSDFDGYKPVFTDDDLRSINYSLLPILVDEDTLFSVEHVYRLPEIVRNTCHRKRQTFICSYIPKRSID